MQIPFDQIENVIRTAGLAGQSATSLVNLFQSLKGALKTPEADRDTQIETAVLRLEGEVKNTQLQNDLLQAQLMGLNQEIERRQKAQEELRSYVMHQTEAGWIVYRSPEAEQPDQPPHFICPTCYERGLRSVLQGGENQKRCKPCRETFLFAKPAPVATTANFLRR
ncbi:hypothetical protein KM176_06370 [Pseudooceanicola sp. CBS1P-1]|uniref:Uncharacterized protein n=1 Tax=Pseudooceanicola albus TaxID=2692189 RepID=A0A6L7FXQ9_9RHOB|nr:MULTISPECIES: hypothetical protein [Pseudooceanicola]MBT9383476.1 hypothetical protein [Pseudooceanicola endophyticus]MXN16202.1 hypothetical protein [Pseudooceanicola albus]